MLRQDFAHASERCPVLDVDGQDVALRELDDEPVRRDELRVWTVRAESGAPGCASPRPQDADSLGKPLGPGCGSEGSPFVCAGEECNRPHVELEVECLLPPRPI